MATTTPRIGLTKPDGTDLVDIAVLNTNFDKIDSNIASTKIQATKPATANAGDLWWDSDTGTLYLYYVDANSSQWVAATSDPINIGVVASQAERDAQYPTPAQGMRVYRTDLGSEEAYYGLYNASTNPGGRTSAGWYQTPVGRVLQVVDGSVNTSYSTNQYTWITTGLTATITPKYANSRILIFVTQNGCGKGGGDTTLQLRLMRNSSVLDYFATGGAWTQSTAVNFGQTMGGSFIDSPATTSAVTYSTQFAAYSPNNGTVYVQYGAYGNPTSRIILMEIAG